MDLRVRPNRIVGKKKYVHYYVDVPIRTVKTRHWKIGTHLELRKGK